MRKFISFIVILTFLILPVSGVSAVNSPEQEVRKSMTDYYDLKYRILSTLKFDKGIEAFIVPELLKSAEVMNEADVVETIVGCRLAQINDLRFDKYKFDIVFGNVKVDGENAWLVLNESYELYFNCAPTVRNKTVVEHVVMCRKVGGKWLIVKDDYMDQDGIKQQLNDNFLDKHLSKDAAKKAVVSHSEGQSSGMLNKLQDIFAGNGQNGLAVFYKDRNIAFIGGKAVRIDLKSGVSPMVRNGMYLLPVRFVAESLGASVSYDEKTATVNVSFNSHIAKYKAGVAGITLDNANIPLKTPVMAYKNRTMLPVETLALAFGKKVYDNGDGLVILSDSAFDNVRNAGFLKKLTDYFEVLYTKADFPRIDGSTATYPLSMEIGKQLLGLDETGVKGFITHKTTHNAYVNLINGTADIIFVTQPSPEEYSLAEKNGIKLEVVPICKEGFVFLVNEENPVNDLSEKQVRDIYRGIIKNWKDAGGEDREIIPYQREANSGSQTIMENTVMKGLKMMAPPKEILVYGMGELIDRVADFSNARNALGYSVYYYATSMYKSRAIKLLSINNVKPEKSTISNGDYPFTVSYYAVLRSDEPKDGSARRLLKWLLDEEGQAVVDKAGLVPIGKINQIEVR